MPNVTIYIRAEDYEVWQKLYSPEWMHELIEKEAKGIDNGI